MLLQKYLAFDKKAYSRYDFIRDDLSLETSMIDVPYFGGSQPEQEAQRREFCSKWGLPQPLKIKSEASPDGIRARYITEAYTEPRYDDGAFQSDLENMIAQGFNHRSLFTFPDTSLRQKGFPTLTNHLDRKRKLGDVLDSGAPKVSGFHSILPYTAVSVIVDFDHDLYAVSAVQTKILTDYLDSISAPYFLWYSGNRGYHVEILRSAIGYGAATDLDVRMKAFVRELVKEAEVFTGKRFYKGVIDYGLYSRTHNIRLPNSIEPGRSYKILLTAEMLTAKDDFGMGRADRPSLIPSYANQAKHPVLSEIWNRYEAYKSPVEVLQARSLPGYAGGQITYQNVSELFEHVASQPLSKVGSDSYGNLKVECRCPNPNHPDLKPSAAVWEAGTGHCFKCGSFSPQTLAQWLGIKLVMNAPTKPLTSLQEARAKLSSEMESNWTTEGIHVWKIPVGVGKSHTAKLLIDKMGASASYSTPSHHMGSEHARDLAADHLRAPWEVESRCISEPMLNGTMPTRQTEMIYVDSLSEPRASVCATCPLNPKSKDFDASRAPCGFLALKEQVTGSEETLVHAHAYLQHPNAKAKLNSGRDLWVYDESPMTNIIAVETFSLDAVRALHSQDREVPTILGKMPLSKVVEPLLRGELNPRFLTPKVVAGEQRYDSLISSHYNTASFTDSSATARVSQSVMDLVDEDGFLGLHDLQVDEEATRLLNVLTRKDATHAGIYIDEHTGKETLMLRFVADLSIWPETVHILDATITPVDAMMLEAYTGREVHYHEITCTDSSTVILHDPSCTMSRASLGRQLERHDDPQHDDFDRYASVLSLCSKLIADDGQDQIGIVGHKDSEYATRLLEDLGLDEKTHYMWYGNLRGLNGFTERRNLVVLGDPSPHPIAFATEAFRTIGKVDKQVVGMTTRKNPTQGVHYEYVPNAYPEHEIRRAGYALNYQTLQPSEGILHQHVYDRVIRDEMYQGIGRIRGLHGDKRIYLLSHVAPNTDLMNQHEYRLKPGLVSSGRVQS